MLLLFLISSCSSSDCDCSYDSFEKIKFEMTLNQVNKVLKSKPIKLHLSAKT